MIFGRQKILALWSLWLFWSSSRDSQLACDPFDGFLRFVFLFFRGRFVFQCCFSELEQFIGS